jgi:hypothetical protein
MRRLFVPLALCALSACDRAPIVWDAAADRRVLLPATTPAASLDATSDSVLRATVAAAIGSVVPSAATDASLAGPPPEIATALGPLCPGTLRTVAGRGLARVSTWWAVHPGTAAVRLVASHSADGAAHWSPPVVVDSLDRAGAGCAYAPPAVDMDTVNGYAHVAYGLTAPEGTGVFYAHRMDPRGPFERPQVIMYGDRPTLTSIASEGDLVVVAYEDPNTGGRPYVAVALSRTAGHSFDERFTGSSTSMGAERPQVALRGRTVVVGWVERTTPASFASSGTPEDIADAARRVVVVRTGHLR